MDILDRIATCAGFDWDKGNLLKNWEKHGVTVAECEQLFFNLPMVAAEDEEHSTGETRYFAIGKTDAGRFLFVVFTVRVKMIRVISARDMNRKERRVYEVS